MPTRKPAKKGKPTPFPQVKGIKVTGTKLRNHVMQPGHVLGIITDQGMPPEIMQEKLAETVARAAGARGPAAVHLDVRAFLKALHAALKDNVAGYCMLLNKGGLPYTGRRWNWAKTKADGSLAWDIDVPMHVASVSKTLTAMAMTKLLDNKKIPYDASIIDYLPTYWTKGPNIDQVTFRRLMTHRSGIQAMDMDYLSMKASVKEGVSSASIGQYCYSNMNFSLCRILIPMVDGFPRDFPYPDVYWDYFTIQLYGQYLYQNVFEPSGVSTANATLDHPTRCALAYQLPPLKGWNSGMLATVCGATGWHISASDLLKVMDAFRRRGTIMATEKAKNMLDSWFGIDVVGDTGAGRFYGKNGIWRAPGLYTEQSLAYFLGEDMELVLLANSPVGKTEKHLLWLVTEIYLANLK